MCYYVCCRCFFVDAIGVGIVVVTIVYDGCITRIAVVDSHR